MDALAGYESSSSSEDDNTQNKASLERSDSTFVANTSDRTENNNTMFCLLPSPDIIDNTTTIGSMTRNNFCDTMNDIAKKDYLTVKQNSSLKQFLESNKHKSINIESTSKRLRDFAIETFGKDVFENNNINIDSSIKSSYVAKIQTQNDFQNPQLFTAMENKVNKNSRRSSLDDWEYISNLLIIEETARIKQFQNQT